MPYCVSLSERGHSRCMAPSRMATQLLQVRDLQVEFQSPREEVTRAVRNVSFSVREGETAALVGESGCGKSTTARAIMGLLPRPIGRITGGQIIYGGTDLRSLSREKLLPFRGSEIAIVFQQALNSLDPTMMIGRQIAEVLRLHKAMDKREARKRAIDLLEITGMPDPGRQARSYPFQLSGGMRQRAVIAMALSGEPRLLIADEPTTALDVTTQAQILDTLKDIRREFGMALLLITHDLGVVAGIADSVYVMYAGSIVEEGGVREVFGRPLHPYTAALLKCTPNISKGRIVSGAAIGGQPPDPQQTFSGCPFQPRCPYAVHRCDQANPSLATRTEGEHRAACWVAIDHTAHRGSEPCHDC